MKLFLVNGFLGSGKTTAIQQASQELLAERSTVGAITNDQGVQLVDSQFLENANIPTREVTGGCFCCNYDNLESSIYSLVEEHDPDIIFAESVGSCTDIISTIVNPLDKFYPNQHLVVSVFADARILPVLVKNTSHFFDERIHYIYKKQLKEADVLVVNKVDLLNQHEYAQVKQVIKEQYPDKKIVYQNTLSRIDIKYWLATLNSYELNSKRKSVDIDYNIYGAGEARLGWLDGKFEIQSFDNQAVNASYKFVNSIFSTIKTMNLPIGHLKFLLSSDGYQRKISFNVGRQEIAKPHSANRKISHMSVLVNARVQTSPERLKNIIKNKLKTTKDALNCSIKEKTLSAFKPGYPNPTHRIIS